MKQRGDADVDVLDEGLSNRLGRTNQSGGVSGCARGGCQRSPEGSVVKLPFRRCGQQPLRTHVLRSGASQAKRRSPPLTPERTHVVLGRFQDAVRPLPRQVLGRAEDGPERYADPEPVEPATGHGRLADRCDLLGGLGERFAPQGKDVGVLPPDPVGRLGRPTEVERNPRVLWRADVSVEVFELVIAGLRNRTVRRTSTLVSGCRGIRRSGRSDCPCRGSHHRGVAPPSLPPVIMWTAIRPPAN